MRITWLYALLQMRLFLRYPLFVTSVLAYPAVLFMFIGEPFAADRQLANHEMIGFAAFALLSNTFFMLGSALARTRASHWEKWLRTLPVGGGTRLSGRVLGAFPFAAASAAAVVIVAVVATPAGLSLLEWCQLLLLLLLGFLVFASLALALAYWLQPMTAPPVIVIVFLVLSYTGDLWTATRKLPAWLAPIARLTPSWHWHELLLTPSDGTRLPLASLLLVAIYALGFFTLAILGFVRDDGNAPWEV